MFKKIDNFLKENKDCYLFLYCFVYLILFKLVEDRTGVTYHIVHSPLDDRIPFNELFAIPYFLWFFYIGYVLIRLFSKSKSGFIKSFIYIFGGMSIGLIIFSIWPTMQNLRPDVMPRDNVLTRLTSFLYSIDTPTNVCPSLHVYVSIGAYMAVRLAPEYFSRFERYAALLLTVSISISTLFLKQHSVIDVFYGIIMSIVMYLIIYVPDYKRLFKNDTKESL